MQFTIILLVLFTEVFAQNPGDNCEYSRTNQPGICASVDDCEFAKKEWYSGHYPQLCRLGTLHPIVCCPVQSAPISVTKSKSLEACRQYFGISGVGGVPAISKEFPHMAALGYKNSDGTITYGCGGSLISERYVLTAAHCLQTINFGQPTIVTLGDLNLKLTSDDAKPRNYNVDRIILHPDYSPPQSYHDIGLIKLDRNVVFDEYVKPACLESVTTNLTEQTVSATGWGQTSYLGDASDHLMKIYLEVFPHQECTGYYAANKRKIPQGILDGMQICAGSRKELRDTCRGDSGGPLQILSGEYFTVVGITSFGKACALTKSPGVYTRVSNYIDWIEKNVWK